jgi:hypothetical protein
MNPPDMATTGGNGFRLPNGAESRREFKKGVVDLARGKGTSEAMNSIEKEFGANVTTRNWHTVLKALQ